MKCPASVGFSFLLSIFLWGTLGVSPAPAQDLPPIPTFNGGEDQCGQGAVIYQPSDTSFAIGYDAAFTPSGFHQYRFHVDGNDRNEVDALDRLPTKGITTTTLQVGPGKAIDLTPPNVLYARLRAYNDQGRESDPANLTLVKLATPGTPTVSGTVLNWTGVTLPAGVTPAPQLRYQIFRFACGATAICSTTPGELLVEQSTTSFDLGTTDKYRYAVRAVIRFADDSPPLFSQPSISAVCACDPEEVELTVQNLGSKDTPSAQFTIQEPMSSAATITASGTLCWTSGGKVCQPPNGIGLVSPAGAPRNPTCFDNPDCANPPASNLNHAAFFYQIGNQGASPQTGSSLPIQPTNTVIFLRVNDSQTDNNSGGFTINLSYNSAPPCGG